MITHTGSQSTRLAMATLRLCRCWELQRTDGLIIRVTDHDRLVTFDSKEYSPVGGVNATAQERQTGLAPRNMDLIGVIESDIITHEDLRAGLYRNAKLTRYVVDWEQPSLGSFRTDVFWIRETIFSGEDWKFKLESLSARLEESVGLVYGKTCRYRLGDAFCDADGTIDVTTNTHTGEVDTVSPTGLRTTFTADATSFGSQSDQYYAHGRLLWLTGANAGVVSETKAYTDATRQFILKMPTPHNIVAGDTFDASVGCSRLIGECKEKFDNVVNFGGFPFLPGTDNLIRSPNGKS